MLAINIKDILKKCYSSSFTNTPSSRFTSPLPYFSNNSLIHFCHPFGTFNGLDNLLSKCLLPLIESIPDLERRDMIVMAGTIMYVIEGGENGFTSIPRSIYWTIVTITTVGYGDITPQTPLGQVIATLAMLTGYSIIAIPTGIFTAEIAREMHNETNNRRCNICERTGHHPEAEYCYHCGVTLPDSAI